MGPRPHGWIITSAIGITPDGQTLAGSGIHNGRYEAWLATIPEPGQALLLLLVALSFAQSAWRAHQSRCRPGERDDMIQQHVRLLGELRVERHAKQAERFGGLHTH
jgi:hypothetical protein